MFGSTPPHATPRCEPTEAKQFAPPARNQMHETERWFCGPLTPDRSGAVAKRGLDRVLRRQPEVEGEGASLVHPLGRIRTECRA